ncbi:hypothetical protein D3C73_1356230 [compost metagenome]
MNVKGFGYSGFQHNCCKRIAAQFKEAVGRRNTPAAQRLFENVLQHLPFLTGDNLCHRLLAAVVYSRFRQGFSVNLPAGGMGEGIQLHIKDRNHIRRQLPA